MLKGKVAIITGAARGMGEASARRFVEEGARVVLADVLDELGEAVAESLGSAAIYRHADVTQASQVQSLVETAVGEFDGLHIMFNNAGTLGAAQKDFLEEDFESFQNTLEINLLGPLLGASYAARHMARNGGGCILSTASSSALYGGYGVIPYRTTKAGVVGMTKSLAVELGRFGIRVNCISPGPTRTPMTVAMDGAPEDRVEELVDISMECMREECRWAAWACRRISPTRPSSWQATRPPRSPASTWRSMEERPSATWRTPRRSSSSASWRC